MKNILKRIGLIALAVFVGVGSLFICNLSNTNFKVASASVSAPDLPVVIPPSVGDVTTNEGLTFYGSDIIYSSITFRTNATLVTDFSKYNNSSDSGYYYNSSYSYLNFCFGLSIPSSNDFTFYYYANRGAIGIYNPSQLTVINPNSGVPQGVFYSTTLNGFNLSTLRSDFVVGDIYSQYGVTPMQAIYVFGSTYYYNFGFEIYRNNTETSSFVAPTLSMYYVILTNTYEMEQYLGVTPKFTNSNIICYIDTAGYYYIYYIPFGETSNSPPAQSFFLQYRRYILQETDLSDNQYYQQGLQDGFADGIVEGRTLGYTEGQSAGYLAGKQAGYNEGAEDANHYTFLSLMGAVVDAPLTAFSSMFDFDLLGVNLRDFFFAILTFCFLTIIVKFALMKG